MYYIFLRYFQGFTLIFYVSALKLGTLISTQQKVMTFKQKQDDGEGGRDSSVINLIL